MIKIFFRRIHLYLSLAAGLVILIACLTGAILVFEKDLQMHFNKQRYFVVPETQKMSLAQLEAAVQGAYPTARVNGIKVYGDAGRSAEASISLAEHRKETAAAAKRQPSYTVFINPYTGQILEKYTYSETFFYKVFALHRWLLGGNNSIGKYIVGVATFMFLFILITGIILWWPKTRNVLKQRLRIKANAGWKRLNHDLHLVLGFYSAIFLFIFAFTGLAWSFEWFNKGIYRVTNSPLKNPPAPQSAINLNAEKIGLDAAYATVRNMKPNAVYYNVSKAKGDSGVITVQLLSNNAPHESATDAVYIDQYSGAIAGALAFSEKSLGARVRSTFKPVHTGSIWGTPSKIVAFFVCLFGVSFPVTGTIMWLNRTKKKKRIGKTANRKRVSVLQ